MDILTTQQRSEVMSRIRAKDTQPELRVRRKAHALGLRFRLHRKDLPGSPDIVFPARRVAMFVHGCFWHRHEGCRLAYIPKSNENFWFAKFARNVERDANVMTRLRQAGWTPVVMWECETEKSDLSDRIMRLVETGTA